MDYIFVLARPAAAAAFVFGGLGMSFLLAPHKPGLIKNSPYECGDHDRPARIQFNVGYYLFALMFLVFDVEAVFLYPWASLVRECGWPASSRSLFYLDPHGRSGVRLAKGSTGVGLITETYRAYRTRPRRRLLRHHPGPHHQLGPRQQSLAAGLRTKLLRY